MSDLTRARDEILYCVMAELSIPPSKHYLNCPLHIIDNIGLTFKYDRLVLEFFGEGGIVVAIPDYQENTWCISTTFLGNSRESSAYLNDFDAFWHQLVIPYLEDSCRCT
jgi:hypothetical protein